MASLAGVVALRMFMAMRADAIRGYCMRSALDQVSDQEHGNKGNCEYTAKFFHIKSLAQGGWGYNCDRRSQFRQHPHRHTDHHQVFCEGDEPKRHLAIGR